MSDIFEDLRDDDEDISDQDEKNNDVEQEDSSDNIRMDGTLDELTKEELVELKESFIEECKDDDEDEDAKIIDESDLEMDNSIDNDGVMSIPKGSFMSDLKEYDPEEENSEDIERQIDEALAGMSKEELLELRDSFMEECNDDDDDNDDDDNTKIIDESNIEIDPDAQGESEIDIMLADYLNNDSEEKTDSDDNSKDKDELDIYLAGLSKEELLSLEEKLKSYKKEKQLNEMLRDYDSDDEGQEESGHQKVKRWGERYG